MPFWEYSTFFVASNCVSLAFKIFKTIKKTCLLRWWGRRRGCLFNAAWAGINDILASRRVEFVLLQVLQERWHFRTGVCNRIWNFWHLQTKPNARKLIVWHTQNQSLLKGDRNGEREREQCCSFLFLLLNWHQPKKTNLFFVVNSIHLNVISTNHINVLLKYGRCMALSFHTYSWITIQLHTANEFGFLYFGTWEWEENGQAFCVLFGFFVCLMVVAVAYCMFTVFLQAITCSPTSIWLA